jgi:two-component system alkaline phosphatase synthesis response regulator PhoP
MLARRLRRAGYQLTEAFDGDTAIALLQQARADAVSYDVVLTDIMLGPVNGMQVTRAALQQPDAPAVILITGHGSLDTAVASLRHGAFDYLLKPVEMAHLLERIATAVEQRAIRLQVAREATGLRQITDVPHQVQADAVPSAGDEPSATTARPPHIRYIGALSINTARYEVWYHDQRVHVTPTEFAVLVCLSERPGQVIDYEAIVQRTHGKVLPKSEARALLVTHIRNLRRKIDPQMLVGVRGVGFMLHEGETRA